MRILKRRRALVVLSAVVAGIGALWTMAHASAQGKVVEVTLDGDHYAFSPTRIDVQKDDLVKVTFHARDIAHSFTIDAYRIAKRAAAGQSIVFEFRADQPGTFPFYCNLTQDAKCRQMHGQMVVK